jgi:hypothetical protein
MEPESVIRSGFSLKGSAGLVVAVVVVAVLLIMLPAYRWFFLISVLIGLIIAGGLTNLVQTAPDQRTRRTDQASSWSVAGRL